MKNNLDRSNYQRIMNQHSASLVGAEAALKRAAIKARKRAIETSGSVAIFEDGKIVHVTEVPELNEGETERV